MRTEPPHDDDGSRKEKRFSHRSKRLINRGAKADVSVSPFERSVLFRIKGFVPSLPKEQYEALPPEKKVRKRFGSLELGNLNITAHNLLWVIQQVKQNISPLSGIHVLILNANPIGDEGLARLIDTGLLDFLPSINLINCGITPAGAITLANATRITAMVGLNLNGNAIGDAGVQAIACAVHFKTLSALSLGNCDVSPVGAEALAGGEYLTELKRLYLGANRIGDKGAQAIATAARWAKMTSLGLNGTGIGKQGATALANASSLSELSSLDLGGNQIGDEGAEAIFNATKWRKLKSLDLKGNGIGEAGAMALANASHLTELISLEFVGNRIGDAQVALELLTALERRSPDVRVSLEGNRLAWGDKPPLSPVLLQEEFSPAKLKALLVQLKDKGVEFSFVRAVMAGTSGSGKTHLSRRFESPDDASLNQPLPESERATKGIVRRRAKVDPADLRVTGLPPRVWLMVQDVGGHTEQIKCHYHLAYLAGNSLFVLCMRMDKEIDHWPRYYLHLLADLGRRAYNGQTGIPRSMNGLPVLEPGRKLKVLVVPTHCDRIDDSDQQSDIRDKIHSLCEITEVQKTLDVKVLACISCLDGARAAGTLKRLTTEIKNLPYAGTLELSYVEPILAKVEQALPPPTEGSGAEWKCSFTHEELKAIFAEHGEVDFDYMVRVILRAGLLLTPLDEVPLQENEVEHKVGLLLNPAFVNEFIYGTLIYGPRSNSWGFVPTNEMHEQMRPATRTEQNAIIRTLESHQVIIECKRHDGTEGYLVPDRFEMRPSGQFIPRNDSTVRLTWTADNFVPEHALFELIARHRIYLEPIDRQGADIKTYAYRNACLFKEDQTEAQVYLNVLTRKLYMCGRGEGAEALIMRLFNAINHESVHGWKKVENECWGLRLEVQSRAIDEFDKLVAKSSNATDPTKKKATRDRYRKECQTILLQLNKIENRAMWKQTDEEIALACNFLGERAHIAEIRKHLTDAKLLEQESTASRSKCYSLSHLGMALVECMDSNGNAKVRQMPTFDPDKDSEDHTPLSLSINKA